MTTDADGRELVPIACTLGVDEGAQRLREWRELTQVAGLPRKTASGRVTLVFRDLPGVREDLERLVAAERLCCSFLGWRIVPADDQLRVEVTGTDEALRTLPGS